jgi:tetratricopeptide (TPR) repeat protein
MSHTARRLATVALLIALSTAFTAQAAPKNPVSPGDYQGREPAAAAGMLLERARAQAGKGTWERIAVGRVLYLTGKKAEGQQLFDEVMTEPKAAPDDWIRIGRVYYEAGEWDKARPLFDKVIVAAPKDEDWYAEIGAYYLVKGDRTTAEKLFARSFELDPSNVHNSVRAAAAYLGLAPR